MAKQSPLAADRFTFKLYKRSLPKGDLALCPLFEKGNNVVLADRSTGQLTKAERRGRLASSSHSSPCQQASQGQGLDRLRQP